MHPISRFLKLIEGSSRCHTNAHRGSTARLGVWGRAPHHHLLLVELLEPRTLLSAGPSTLLNAAVKGAVGGSIPATHVPVWASQVPSSSTAGTGAQSSSATQHETLGDLPAAAQSAISSAIGQDQSAYHATSSAAGVTLANAANGFTASMQSGNLVVAVGANTWDLSLAGLGYGGAIQPVGTAQTTVNGNRVDNNYGTVDEWYVNGPGGLEQGFNVSPTPQDEASGSLTVALAMGGDLSGTVNAAGDGLTLTRPDGSMALGYTGLEAHDAAGTTLPASLEVQTVGGQQELLIHVNDAGAQGQITIDPFFQTAELTESDSATDSLFGWSVAISGNTVVVGAPEDMGGSVIGPGAAYVFTESGSGWADMTETAKLTASDGVAGAAFGAAVAIDGNTVVVGAPDNTVSGDTDEGAVYVFAEPVSGWGSESNITQTTKLVESDGSPFADNFFGDSVAISDSTVVVEGQGLLYVFDEPASGWGSTPNMTQTAELTVSDSTAGNQFANAVSISGNTIVVGTESATVGANESQGAAYMFTKSGSSWTQTAKLTASDGAAGDQFGNSVAINGNTVVVGAYYASVGGNMIQGAAYVFTEPAAGWAGNMTQSAKLTASDGAADDLFGASVAVSGNTVVVGPGPGGAAYVLIEPANGWGGNMTETTTSAPDSAASVGLGGTVAVDGDTVVDGLVFATVGNNENQGAAFVFIIPSSTVTPPATQLAFAQQPNTGTTGAAISPAITVDVKDADGDIITSDTSSVTLSIASGPVGATLGGMSTVSVVNGVATFNNLFLSEAGIYTLTASDGTLSLATSTSFQVIGPATQLAFDQQPSDTNTTATISPAVTVDVEDADGNIVTSDDSSITLYIASGPGGAVLAGTTTVAAVDGVATFDDLSLAKAGAYTLTARDGALSPDTSTPFNAVGPVTYSVSESWSMTITDPNSPGDGVTSRVIKRSGVVKGTIEVVQDQFGEGIYTLINNTGAADSETGDLESDGTDYTVNGPPMLHAFIQRGLNFYVMAQFSFAVVLVPLPSSWDFSLFGEDDFYSATGTSSDLVGTGTAVDGNNIEYDGSSVAEITLVSNPALPRLAFGQQPTNTAAGNIITSTGGANPPVTVDVKDASGNLLTSDNSSVTIALSANSNATLDGTLTEPVINGVATFGDLSLTQAGPYTLVATDGAYTAAKSNSFTVSPDTTSSQLVLIQQPVAAVVGKPLSPALIVDVDDQYGNLVTTGTDSTSKVALSIVSGPNGGTLGGVITVTAIKGVATFSKATLSMAGDYTLQIADLSLPIATPVQVTQTITQGVTTVATPHPSSSYTFGQTLNLSTTFKSTAATTVPFTGTASILDQSSQVLGTGTLTSAGLVKFTLTGVVPGTYDCTLSYPGDTNHTAVTSSAFTLQVNLAGTTTSLAASTNTLVFGQPLTLTATVKSSNAPAVARTGSVNFYDGTTLLQTVPLTGNAASYMLTPASVGKHSYKAVYSGDSNFKASTSSGLSRTVSKDKTSILLTPTLTSPIAENQTFNLNVQMAVLAPGVSTLTGDLVTIKDNGKTLGTLTLDSSGDATLTGLNYTVAGTQSLTALFAGDADTLAVTSPLLKLTVM